MRYLLNKPINLNRHRSSFEDVPDLHPLLLINLLRRLGLEVWDCVSSCSQIGWHRSSGTSASNSIDIKRPYIVLIFMLSFAFVHTFIKILIDIIVSSDLVAHFDRALVPSLCRDTHPGCSRMCISANYIAL